jgi:hypothetical protein
MDKAPAFDMMLGVMVGTIVSRPITDNAPLGPALAATGHPGRPAFRPDDG